MKKLLYVLMTMLLVLVSSCETMNMINPKPYHSVSMFCYTPLTDKGVFVTESNSVGFEYNTVGSLYATVHGGWVNGTYEEPSVDKLFDIVLNKLYVYKANGMVNLRVNTSSSPSGYATGKYTLNEITLTAMAIQIPNRKSLIFENNNINPSNEAEVYVIDGVSCRVIESSVNSIRIATSKELSVDQMKKAKDNYLQKQIQFNLEGSTEKGKAYAGITDNYIVIYKTNEFIKM